MEKKNINVQCMMKYENENENECCMLWWIFIYWRSSFLFEVTELYYSDSRMQKEIEKKTLTRNPVRFIFFVRSIATPLPYNGIPISMVGNEKGLCKKAFRYSFHCNINGNPLTYVFYIIFFLFCFFWFCRK